MKALKYTMVVQYFVTQLVVYHILNIVEKLSYQEPTRKEPSGEGSRLCQRCWRMLVNTVVWNIFFRVKICSRILWQATISSYYFSAKHSFVYYMWLMPHFFIKNFVTTICCFSKLCWLSFSFRWLPSFNRNVLNGFTKGKH